MKFSAKKLSGVLLALSLSVSAGVLSVNIGKGDEYAAAPTADASVFVGESVRIQTLLDFDEDDAELLSAEVRSLADNSAVEVSGGAFVPERAGMYKVTLIKDVGGKMLSSYYYVQAEYSKYAVVSRNPSFPYAFVEGETYALDLPVAYVYGEDGKRTEAEISAAAVYGGESEPIGSDFRYTPDVERSGDKVRIDYTLSGREGKTSVCSYEIPVVEINGEDGLQMQNLFVRELIDDVRLENSYFTAYTSSDNASLKFCNPIPADDFRLRWRMLPDYARFEEWIVTLTDYENESERVDLSFTSAGGGGTYLSINGGPDYLMQTSFSDGSFTISYSQSKRSISDNNGQIATVDSLADGEAFGGFSSGIVKVSVSFGRVRGYSAVSLSHLGNQALAGTSRDSISPYIFFEDEVRVRYDQGETVKINKAEAYDILDPSATVSVSVYKLNEDGSVSDEIVSDAEGNPIRDYDCSRDVFFEGEDICSYRVEYTAVDWNNRSAVIRYIYTINDSEPPVVSFGTMAASGSVGSPVRLPSVSWTDNDGADKVQMLVTYLTPSNVVEVVLAGENSFTPTERGRYRVTCFVYDSNYNYVLKEYIVEVE